MNRWWHGLLRMRRHDRTWHKRDMLGEMAEFREARTTIEKLSELSDVMYTYTRAAWTGHALPDPLRNVPSLVRYGVIAPYMIGKYSSRFLFYSVCSGGRVREVRNPTKRHKLEEIAQTNGLDHPGVFVEKCERLRRWWPFLP